MVKLRMSIKWIVDCILENLENVKRNLQKKNTKKFNKECKHCMKDKKVRILNPSFFYLQNNLKVVIYKQTHVLENKHSCVVGGIYMRLFKDVECVYSYRDNNMELRGGKYDCSIVSDKGLISFAVIDVGEQLLINEDILMKALKENESIETNGVYLYLREENIDPVERTVHINVMPLVTNLYVTDSNNAIGLSNLKLRSILNI